MKSLKALLTVIFGLLILNSAFAQSETRLLRFPAIFGDRIVFSYAGDLYSVSSKGGTARKLTSDLGYEMFARFSPDGKQIAFTAQYDGNTEVYLMPAEGGIPRRLTFTATLDRDDVSDRMGPNNIVMGWKGSNQIIYRSRKDHWNDFKGDLLLVSVDGGLSEKLPLPRGGFCSYSPDLRKLAYNRIFREFRTWKRYRGGQADDVWIYDFESKQTTNITGNPAQDIFPMWTGNTIYFISDRDESRRFNLYGYDLLSKQTRKYTNFTDFDIKFPSLGNDAIVFENGGYIYRFDLKSRKAEKVPIYVADDQVLGRGGWTDVSRQITNYEIAPDGSRALFGAHGEIFTVPAKYGNTRNLTNTSGVHERASKWSPDGKWIAYISDASGEDEIYIVPQDGSGPAKQLTKGADTYKFSLLWSPDSRKLLWSDKKLRLQYVDLDSGNVTQVAEAKAWEITDFNWSPDSKWIAYSQQEEMKMQTIYLYSCEKKETIAVTDGWFDSGRPAFSEDGKYLFFVSDRTFNPVYGQTEFNYSYSNMSKIYLVTLTKEVPSPFKPKSDEVKIREDVKEPAKDANGAAEKKPNAQSKPVEIRVDAEGIVSRIAEVPVAAAAYDHLVSVGSRLYYERRRGAESKLVMFDLEKLKETELGDADGYEISADNKKMLVGQGGSYAIVDLPTGKFDLSERLNLSDLKFNLDREAEWKQIYSESWRQMRDFFYAPNMHGVDWAKVRSSYESLIPFVRHRADLTYIIGEMIGELSAGHTYVGGGDMPRTQRIKMGLLGAVLEKDAASGFFRIKKILKGQNWDKAVRSPLTDIGVDAREGDYILAVDGKPTDRMRDIYESLVNTVGKQVRLKLNSKPEEAGSRETVVVPIEDERPLYYYEWVQGNLEKVTKATQGKVGYIHIPDMGVSGLNEFVKYYYPQLRKEALIVDVRGNGGGNVSPMVIERLRRDAAMIDIARNTAPSFNPGGLIPGPKVALLDEFSASDGDIFPYRFRYYKLGKLIGKRSWGGVVGIRGTLPIVDGGYLNRPEFSRYDLAGKEWIMEGHGVDPDIVVDNDPAKEYAGVDEQLNRAIEEIQKEMKAAPVTLPPPPPYPTR
ncbi:MAG: PDZ domain-containing protein [Acidobacteriota bacterium]|nr:PDZ domain-containing protein [Acidobacteriota bacterium]